MNFFLQFGGKTSHPKAFKANDLFEQQHSAPFVEHGSTLQAAMPESENRVPTFACPVLYSFEDLGSIIGADFR